MINSILILVAAFSPTQIEDYVRTPLQLSLSAAPEAPDRDYHPAAGDRAVACGFSESAYTIYHPTAMANASAYDEYWKSVKIKDVAGLDDLGRQGLSFVLRRGTELLVLEVEPPNKDDVRPPCATVRVMSGPLTGKKLWIIRYAVNRMVKNAYYKPKPEKKLADPAEWAKRALVTAKGLEASGKTAAALTTYRRVVADVPGTPPAAEAAARVKALTR